jgi:AcrR family transcriptional regulator
VARPRENTDDRLLDAADAVLAQTGSARFTLEMVAREAGVSAPTLVKRFGSKRGLLIASSQRWVDSIDLDDIGGPDEPILTTLHRLSVESYTDSDDADRAGNHVSSLSMDLGDPTLTRLLAVGWDKKRQQLEAVIHRAVADGELRTAPHPSAAARTLFALLEGTFLGWTVEPHGSLIDSLDDEFNRLITTWT